MLTKKRFESVSKLFSYCTELSKEKGKPPLNAFVVFPTKERSPEDISKIARKRKLKFRIQKTGKNLYFVKVGVRKRLVPFQLIANKSWWLFLGDGKSRILRDVLIGSFIGNHLSWALEPAYIDTVQFANLFDGLALQFDRVSVTDCRYYQPGVTKMEFRRKGFQLPYYSGLLRQLEDDTNGTLSAAKIEFSSPESLTNKARIQTQSQLTFYNGYFTDFYQSIVLPYAEEAQNTRNRFSNKERRIETKGMVIHPTTIEYSKGFTTEEIEKLQEVLVREYSTSIVYYNPVMIAHITDRLDGSCFDIYLEEKKVQVVPMTRATSGSYTQLFSLLAKYSPQIHQIKDESSLTPI